MCLVLAVLLAGCKAPSSETGRETDDTAPALPRCGPDFTGNWSAAGLLPEERCYPTPAVAVGDRIYLAGGMGVGYVNTYNAEVWTAEVVEGQVGPWEELASLPGAITDNSLTSLGDGLVVIGGVGNEVNTPTWVAMFDEYGAIGAWEEGPRLPITEAQVYLVYPKVVRIGDSVVVTAGSGGGGANQTTWSAPLLEGGGLGDWTEREPLPFPADVGTLFSWEEELLYSIATYSIGHEHGEEQLLRAQFDGETMSSWVDDPAQERGCAHAATDGEFVYLQGCQPLFGETALTGNRWVQASRLAPAGEMVWQQLESFPYSYVVGTLAVTSTHLLAIGGQEGVGDCTRLIYSMPLCEP